ncbi:ATP-binding protein [Cognataquiflexum rubidum]|uniref:ATP-binding protein n=1 Tax=Cognataquiflexum rubidum TaxID=2922273 RepID=UPI001F14477B|nr:ATP-binding protein [Cognataquiflexum rubidum]MCH6235773.1 ATP-binding protein [Cognataquiflexum rubidum]
MKTVLKIALLLFLPLIANAQKSKPDSLRMVLENATNDKERHNASTGLYFYYFEGNRDSALFYAEKRFELARKNNQKLAEAGALISIGYQFSSTGKYSKSFQSLLQALKITEDPKNKEVPGWTVTQYPFSGDQRLWLNSVAHTILGGLMTSTGNNEQGIVAHKKSLSIAEQINSLDRQVIGNANLGIIYFNENKLDSAMYFAKAAYLILENYDGQQFRGNTLLTLGNIYLAKGDRVQARRYYYEGLLSASVENSQSIVANINHTLVDFFVGENKKDSALIYAIQNLKAIESSGGIANQSSNMGTAYEDLYRAYKLSNQKDSAYKYLELASVILDSLNEIRIKNLADFQKLSLSEAMRLEQLENERIQTQAKIRTYGMLAGLAILSIIGFILYRNNRQKQKANKVLESALTNLKSTQAQLIQSEKMASLGELTAGIAHEIQNPLNFVNNFSEVSAELMEELKGERLKVKSERSEIVEEEIIGDVIQNLEKINYHGKRADAIVKGMLEHSRSGSGARELTDVNTLANEYLNLSYQSFKSKNKEAEITLVTDFDSSVPKMEFVRADIGKVLLNILNNAFYACTERSRSEGADKAKLSQSSELWESYKPQVTVSTKSIGDKIEISIKDNGPGIPDSIKGKIFQPFFTTKPTGQGTGLGLSLSYDIVKAHGGELKVETKEGEGSVFQILLPTNHSLSIQKA